MPFQVAALNCKTCSNYWKKLFQSCVMPVAVSGDPGTDLENKILGCIAQQDALDQVIAAQCGS